jgi:hypothetical protein
MSGTDYVTIALAATSLVLSILSVRWSRRAARDWRAVEEIRRSRRG